MDRAVTRKDDRAAGRPREAKGGSALREVVGVCLELLYRRDENVHDHFQRKRHYTVSDVAQQVAAAEPAAPLWRGGLLEKNEMRAQVGAARRCLMMGIAQNYPRRTFQGPKRQHRRNRHPPECIVAS